MQTSIRKKKRVKYIAGLLLVCGLLLLGKKQVFAESGSIYTCSITTSYTHPVTGVIEDSGGEASAATRSGHGRKCRWNTGDFGSDRFRKILPDGSLQSDGLCLQT